jgi:hypothetical protein
LSYYRSYKSNFLFYHIVLDVSLHDVSVCVVLLISVSWMARLLGKNVFETELEFWFFSTNSSEIFFGQNSAQYYMYLGFQVKCSVFLSDFNRTQIFPEDFNESVQHKISGKSTQWEMRCSKRIAWKKIHRQTDRKNQHSETNVMHFLFNLLRIKSLYMFRALLAHPQEALIKRHLVYCVRVISVGCTRIESILVQPTDITRTQYTKCRLIRASRGWASNDRNM